MPDNRYDTILEALEAAQEKKFLNSFACEKRMLHCIETGEIFSPSALRICEFHRVEGASDPDESAIIYFIESTSGMRGTLTDSYGAYANNEISELIKKIPIQHSGTAGPFENKHCRNCGALLNGPYCHDCGQKDQHLHEPFYRLVWEGFTDYWHFDSKFVNTFSPLISRPGYLTREFIEGRRVRYVHPIRLYFFLSVIFFLIFFAVANEQIHDEMQIIEPLTTSQKNIADSATKLIEKNTQKLNRDLSDLNASAGVQNQLNNAQPAKFEREPFDSATGRPYTEDTSVRIEIGSLYLPQTVELYDDSIRKMPADKRPSGLKQSVSRSLIRITQMPEKELLKQTVETATHNLPKLMFVLLPIFALILKLIYVRRKIYLIDHGIFALHFHAFAFLVMIFILIIYLLTGWTLGFGWLMLLLLTYLFIAMKNFYRQSFFKTFLKLFSLSLIYSFISIIVGAAYVVITLFSVA